MLNKSTLFEKAAIELKQSKEKMQTVFEKNGLNKKLAKIAPKAGAVFFTAWFLAALLTTHLLLSLLIATICGMMALLFFWWLPLLREKNRFEKVEAELPFVLLGISIELRLQRPFEKILEKAGQSDFRFAGIEFQKVSQEVLVKGASVPEALQHLAERLQGLESKRAVIQLAQSYEQGTKKGHGMEVKRIANELLAKQRIQTKAFSAKLALFSLVFIMVSAIVPALFQSFMLVGSTFLSLDFSALQVLVITTIGFPFLDLLVLLLIRFKTPIFLR